ncbi:MAG: peptide chain release factor N(5)-glutamine methyltransferase [Sphingomonadales bacterium]|nr:peptide chain release factor N(5)-glutamine methyltransferase [Sphingomonadales bacterium]
MKENTAIIALDKAAAALSGVSDTPRLDAEILLAHALNMDRNEMLMRRHELSAPISFTAMLSRRMAHEPVAYITGIQHFWDLTLTVNPDVLIPRSDSEALLDAAVHFFKNKAKPSKILDLGTGSGALILAALSLFPMAKGVAIDASLSALKVAAQNSRDTGFADRADFLHLSWRDADWTGVMHGPFDLILCNPPYVETGADLLPMVRDYEPASALFSGEEGLDDYRIVLPSIPDLLAEDGTAIFEIGSAQAERVSGIAQDSGLKAVLTHDLAGNPRALTMTKRV